MLYLPLAMHRLKRKKMEEIQVMEKYQGALLIIVVCAIVLLILAVKTGSQIIMNLILRAVSGSLMILMINEILEKGEIMISVGLNLGTVLTTGFLGFPGVLLLFGMKIYTLL